MNKGYYFQNRKPFVGSHVKKYLIGQAFNDTYDICFGGFRWRGQDKRQDFHNLFIGKLGEYIVSEYYCERGFKCHRPDHYTDNIGGDDGDLIFEYNGKNYRFSIKTCVYYGNLLTEKCKHFNDDGIYINNNKNILFDRHYLVRVNYNINNINLNISKEDLYLKLHELDWKAEITGYVTHTDFLQIIKNKQIVQPGDLNYKEAAYFARTGELRQLK